MRQFGTTRFALIGAFVVLLLLLLTPHALGHQAFAFLCFIFVPLFLFGNLDQSWTVSSSVATDEFSLCPSAAQPSRFQRPPPSASK